MIFASSIIKKVKEISIKLGLSLQILKTALAAAISWSVATGIFHTHYPFFAPLSAILTVQVTVSDSLQKATQRLIGIVLGVIFSMLMGIWLEINALSIFLMIFLGMTVFNGLKMNAQIISQIAISSFLVLAFGENQDYAIERIIETVIGSGIAVVINALIVPQDAVPEMRKLILALTNSASSTLNTLIALFQTGNIDLYTGKKEVAGLIEQTEKVVIAIKVAQQSLKYTPFLKGTRTRLQKFQEHIVKLEYMTVQIRGIRRGLADLHMVGDFQREFAKLDDMNLAIETTAKCIEKYGNVIVGSENDPIDVLKSSIAEAKARQRVCLNGLKSIQDPIVLRDVGAILTDLNRILDEAVIEI